MKITKTWTLIVCLSSHLSRSLISQMSEVTCVCSYSSGIYQADRFGFISFHFILRYLTLRFLPLYKESERNLLSCAKPWKKNTFKIFKRNISFQKPHSSLLDDPQTRLNHFLWKHVVVSSSTNQLNSQLCQGCTDLLFLK